MPVDIRIEGADKFARLAKALRQIGDTELRRELYAGMNRAVKPLTESVRGATRRYLPDRYADELSETLRVRPRRRAGRDPGVSLTGSAKTRRGKDRDLRALNRGVLRHPLYGNREHWFNQPVKAGWWDGPLTDGADEVRQELVNVLDDIGKKLDRKI